MHVLYVTKNLPYGSDETFIYPEIQSHLDAGWNITVAPVRRGKIVHKSGAEIEPRTLRENLFSARIFRGACITAFKHPLRSLSAFLLILKHSGRPSLLIKNLSVFLKGLWLSEITCSSGISHIHAHWLAVPATMAFVASYVSQIPFSVTAHRYDILQNNMMNLKLKSAKFVRVIDNNGFDEIVAGLDRDSPRPVILYMGVRLPQFVTPPSYYEIKILRIVIAARLIEKKGHIYLLEAINLVIKRGVEVSLDIYGSGPLQHELKAAATDLSIESSVNFLGTASHDLLLQHLVNGRYDLATLPSVSAENGDREGIPVFLMEAMAAGVPTISTLNGGIKELVGEDGALTVSERDPHELAEAIFRIATDPDVRNRIATTGRARVSDQFDLHVNCKALRELIMPYDTPARVKNSPS